MRREIPSPEELVAQAEAAQATKEEVRKTRISEKVSKRTEVIGRAKVTHGKIEKTKAARARIAKLKESVRSPEEELAPEVLEAEQSLKADEIGLGGEIGHDVQEVADLEAEEGVIDALHEEALAENESRDKAKAKSRALVERKKQEQSEREQQEKELKELRGHIDELALKVISIWNEDNGFTLRLTEEKGESDFQQQDDPLVDKLNVLHGKITEKQEELRGKFKANGKPKWFSFGARNRLTKEIKDLEDEAKAIEVERKALFRKSEKTHKNFSNTQTQLGEAVLKYKDLSWHAEGGPIDVQREFPFIRAYREGKGKEARTVGYIEDLPKFFDKYGFDLLKRSKKKGK